MGDQLKILVIEDHPIVRDACLKILSRHPEITVREAMSAEAALEANRHFAPDVILLDIGLPDRSGLEIIAALLAENRRAKVIVFSMYETANSVTRALESGAAGYITKSDDPAMILTAIDRVRAGEVFLGQTIAQKLAMASLTADPAPLGALTERERLIMRHLGQGKSLNEIALALKLGYKTVAANVSTIKEKMQVPTNAALTKVAVELASKHLI